MTKSRVALINSNSERVSRAYVDKSGVSGAEVKQSARSWSGRVFQAEIVGTGCLELIGVESGAGI